MSKPVTVIACGWVLFGERLQGGTPGVVAVVVGLAAMVAGVLACVVHPRVPL